MNIGATRGASGEYGGILKSGAQTTSGCYQGFLAITDCTITWASCVGNITTTGAADSLVLAGTYVPGAWTTIVSTTGVYIIYNRRP